VGRPKSVLSHQGKATSALHEVIETLHHKNHQNWFSLRRKDLLNESAEKQ